MEPREACRRTDIAVLSLMIDIVDIVFDRDLASGSGDFF